MTSNALSELKLKKGNEISLKISGNLPSIKKREKQTVDWAWDFWNIFLLLH